MRGDIRTLLLPCVMFWMDQLLSSTKGWGTHTQCSGLTGVNLRTFFWTHDLCLKKRIKHTASVHPSSGVNVSLMDPWLYKRYLMREQTTKAYIKTTIRVAAWTNVTKNVWGRGAKLHNSNSSKACNLDETTSSNLQYNTWQKIIHLAEMQNDNANCNHATGVNKILPLRYILKQLESKSESNLLAIKE